MKLAKPLILLLSLYCIYAIAGAQTQPNILDSFAKEYLKKIREVNEENVLVRTDRNAYATGEKIWFSAYVSKAANGRLDTASKSLFVDLVNAQDKPVAQLVLNTVGLNTQGAIALNDTLPAGLYWLRGYTMKMAKENINDIYIQPLYIYNFSNPNNSQKNESISAGFQSGNASVHFYPERVTRIQSIYTTGALQITDASGSPVITTGSIVNNHDSVVANFSTNRYGLARINFYNNKLQKFEALVHLKTGDIRYPIPSIDPFKAQVSVTGVNDSSLQAIVTLEDSVYSPAHTTFVLGLSHGRVCFSSYGRGMYKMTIPLSNFPGGTASLLLLDSAQLVLCERDFFIHKNNYAITVQPDKDGYAKRDAVQVGVQVTDASGKPLRAALNVAVQDGKLEEISDMLETDSTGPANHAMDEWFLRNAAKLSTADMDLFMLARPPQYSSQLTNSGNQYNDDIYKLQHLAGSVTDKKGEPVKETVVTELTENKDDYTVYGKDTTGVRGKFSLPLPPNADSLALKLSLSDVDGNPRPNSQIQLDSFVYPAFATPVSLKNKFFISDIAIQKKLDAFDGGIVFSGMGKNWLKPVIVYTKAKPADPYEGTRVSASSHIITPDLFNQAGANTIGSALLSTVPGVSFNGQKVTIHSSSLGEPMVVVDGVPIITPESKNNQILGVKAPVKGSSSGVDQTGAHNPYSDDTETPSVVLSFLKTLDPNDIEYIEVLVNQSELGLYGVRAATGVIYIHTKSGSGKYVEPDAGMVIIHPVTYHSSPKFAMPDYSTMALKNSKTPDPRTTIFWNGRLLTDQDGKAQVKFFTADDNNTYTITVTGATQNGDYIYKRITINRKE